MTIVFKPIVRIVCAVRFHGIGQKNPWRLLCFQGFLYFYHVFKYNGLINKEYAYFYYLSRLYQDKLKSISRTAQVGFNSTDFEDMFFPLPPEVEQKKIVVAIKQYYCLLDNISAEL